MATVTMDMQRTAAAFHEAAHAVVAAALGGDVYACWTDAEGGGEMRFRMPLSAWTPDIGIAISLAGRIAERMKFPGCFGSDAHALDHVRDILDDGADDARERSDCLDIAHLVWDLPEDLQANILDEAHERASEILREQWADVEAIAGCIGGGR
jgi:hypothetical protein